MNAETKRAIENLTDKDIRTTIEVLALLESVARCKMDFDRAESYVSKIQIVERDIRHIREMI